jgi:hypothetical protein
MPALATVTHSSEKRTDSFPRDEELVPELPLTTMEEDNVQPQ